ncbi:MAG TPA: hypothetical protein VNL98_00070 [Gemmatimonadales bacterium]|nr:hypothetical protein [Gemmatimonadales bacterium]
MNWPTPILALAVLSGLLACGGGSRAAAGSGESAPAPQTQRRQARSDPNRLTRQDIEEAMAANIQNMWDLVRNRRPAWLRPAVAAGALGSGGQGTDVAVWVDNTRYGGPMTLQQIPLQIVQSVRYLTPSEAQGRLGLDNRGGAILVETVPRN